jgi:excisionase family DNA binding protein
VTSSMAAARPLTRTDFLSTTEVAELLGIRRSTVHELARRGELPARRGGRWLFLRDRLAAAITPLDAPAAWCPQNRACTLERYSTALLDDASRRIPLLDTVCGRSGRPDLHAHTERRRDILGDNRSSART